MAFTLIIGPIKSGKSLELIARVAPYEFANKKVVYVQPHKNVRDDGITSRLGISTNAQRVKTLAEVADDVDVIGIDEVHMLPVSDAAYIEDWLKRDKEVVVSGLDIDYSATLTPMVVKLLQLKPDLVINKLSVCEVCRQHNAQFTQIIDNGKLVLGGLPAVVPEDGTYQYQARCRACFKKKDPNGKVRVK